MHTGRHIREKNSYAFSRLGLLTYTAAFHKTSLEVFIKNLSINTVSPMLSRALILVMLSYKGAQNPDLVRTVKGNKMLKADVSITADAVKGVLKEYGLEVVAGDAVFVYTGY